MARLLRNTVAALFLVGSLGLLKAAEAAAEPLQTAAAVRSLTAQAAAEGRPVKLRGFLLLATAPRNAVVLLNQGEGIYVSLARKELGELRLGDVYEVEGVSEPGDFAPIIRATRFTRVEGGVLPPPRPTTIAELNAGGFDAAWVELRGIVRSCAPILGDPAHENWQITFAQGADRMTALVNGHVSGLEDAEVSLRAVVFNVHNANRQFVRATLQVPEASMIETLVPAPSDPFARPSQPLSAVLRFSRDGFSGHRVHIQGVVTGHKDGRTLWIREGEQGMRVASNQRGLLKPGDVVEVAGFPDHGSYTPSLSDAVFRRVQSGPPPVPILLRGAEEIARHDSNLVQIYAKLVDARTTGGTTLLLLDWNGRSVEAQFMRLMDEEELKDLEPGSMLRVAGICVAGQANFLKPTGLWMAEDLQLWLRDASDVAVLSAAPWLTARRAMGIVLAFAIVALVALVIVAVAARRQIAQREEARKLAEVEFAAMLAERNRLARDFHDTLAQDLNAVSMQLELAKNTTKAGETGPAGNFLGAAHDIVRKCISEARESIWNMRSHVLERNDLPAALGLVAEQLGAGTSCLISSRVLGRPRRLAPTIENNLLRIGQEAVSNSLKHGHAKSVVIELVYEDACVRLRVTDDGTGFDPAGVGHAPSHFGLRGMRERVEQMHGTLELESTPGGGTAVSIRVDTLPH